MRAGVESRGSARERERERDLTTYLEMSQEQHKEEAPKKKAERNPDAIPLAQIRKLAKANGVTRMNREFTVELRDATQRKIQKIIRKADELKGETQKTIGVDLVNRATGRSGAQAQYVGASSIE